MGLAGEHGGSSVQLVQAVTLGAVGVWSAWLVGRPKAVLGLWEAQAARAIFAASGALFVLSLALGLGPLDLPFTSVIQLLGAVVCASGAMASHREVARAQAAAWGCGCGCGLATPSRSSTRTSSS
jgi:hypothetical protein